MGKVPRASFTEHDQPKNELQRHLSTLTGLGTFSAEFTDSLVFN